LTTVRIRLRPFFATDAAPMARLINDLDIARMTTSVPHPYTCAHARRYIARTGLGDPAVEAVFALDHPLDGFMGVVGLHSTGSFGPELGYWLGRPYWGQGLMTEAVTAVVDWAHRIWRKPVLEAGHFSDNEASGSVLVKAGFLYTGRVEARWSLARAAAAPTRMMVRLA